MNVNACRDKISSCLTTSFKWNGVNVIHNVTNLTYMDIYIERETYTVLYSASLFHIMMVFMLYSTAYEMSFWYEWCKQHQISTRTSTRTNNNIITNSVQRPACYYTNELANVKSFSSWVFSLVICIYISIERNSFENWWMEQNREREREIIENLCQTLMNAIILH